MLRNMTPHPVNLHRLDGTVQTIDPDPAGPARLEVSDSVPADPDGPFGLSPDNRAFVEEHEVQLVVAAFGQPTGLPDPQDGVWLIVSGMLVDALPHRRDLLAPHDIVRDADGKIIGCRKLRQAVTA